MGPDAVGWLAPERSPADTGGSHTVRRGRPDGCRSSPLQQPCRHGGGDRLRWALAVAGGWPPRAPTGSLPWSRACTPSPRSGPTPPWPKPAPPTNGAPAARRSGPCTGFPWRRRTSARWPARRPGPAAFSRPGLLKDATPRPRSAGCRTLAPSSSVRLSSPKAPWGSPSRQRRPGQSLGFGALERGFSSGSGVAVAAGLAYGAIGTDTAGSIRHAVGLQPPGGAQTDLGPDQPPSVFFPLLRHLRPRRTDGLLGARPGLDAQARAPTSPRR